MQKSEDTDRCCPKRRESPHPGREMWGSGTTMVLFMQTGGGGR
ncbi:MAG: hypothetical protein WCB58_13440 [Acidobacteriaceae bacterium]